MLRINSHLRKEANVNKTTNQAGHHHRLETKCPITMDSNDKRKKAKRNVAVVSTSVEAEKRAILTEHAEAFVIDHRGIGAGLQQCPNYGRIAGPAAKSKRGIPAGHAFVSKYSRAVTTPPPKIACYTFKHSDTTYPVLSKLYAAAFTRLSSNASEASVGEYLWYSKARC